MDQEEDISLVRVTGITAVTGSPHFSMTSIRRLASTSFSKTRNKFFASFSDRIRLPISLLLLLVTTDPRLTHTMLTTTTHITGITMSAVDAAGLIPVPHLLTLTA